MRTRSLCAKLGAAAVFMLAAGVVHAQDGLEGAVARLNRAASFAQPVTALSGPTLAAADFDGDNKPDGAVLLSPDLFRGQSNPQVELHLTARNNADITLGRFSSSASGQGYLLRTAAAVVANVESGAASSGDRGLEFYLNRAVCPGCQGAAATIGRDQKVSSGGS
jgi:hypothetical protein